MHLEHRSNNKEDTTIKNKTLLTILLVLITVVGFGCGMESEPTKEIPTSVVEHITESETTEEITETTTSETNATTTVTATTTSETNATTTATETTTTTTTTAVTVELSAPAFSLDIIPEYSGNPYVEVNGNKPYFTDYPNTQFESYSPHDSLGRCGVAFANICVDIMPTEPRGEIGMVKPSGWHTVRYDDLISDKYLYNRCHLIGFQLAGENANEQNLITGTRYMNVQGMEPFENRVANYVKSSNAHILYRVTPIFEGNNLVANGVLMEAYSLEDNGASIEFCVYCYNVQPGIGINYADGESWALESVTETPTEVPTAPPTVAPTEAVQEQQAPVQDNSMSYVLNTNTKKFHYPSCSSVGQMAEHNKSNYEGSRDDVIGMGYEPCGRCNP